MSGYGKRILIHDVLSVCLIVLVLTAGWSDAHPGKTDDLDGHRCLKNCGEWDLYDEEYHLHDKERNPVRIKPGQKIEPVSKPEDAAKAVIEEKPAVPSPTAETAAPSKTPVQPIINYTVSEGNTISDTDILLLTAAGFLLLLLVLIKRRGRAEQD